MKACWITSVALLVTLARAGEAEPAPTPDATALLKQSQTFCSHLNSLACEIEFVRIARADARRRERRSHFEVAFQRPNLLSIQLKADDIVTYSWICDGTDAFVYMWGAEKYTQTKAPASLDDLLAGGEVQIVRRALENAFLLDSLLRPTTDVTHLAGNGIVAPVYVSLDTLEGEKAHHLRFSNGSTRELWLADSPLPLPLKVEGELPLTDEEKERKFAKAEFSVEFKNWLPDVKLDPKVFQFDAKSKGKRASGFLPDLPPHPLLNQPAPAAVLEVLDGQRTTLAAHKGRDVVVLDFWSASCVPCIGLLPKVDAVARKFKGRGVVFYAMNENDAADDVRRFVNARGIGLTVTLHNKTANFDAFKVDAIPMLFVIDKSGVIRVVHTVHSNDLNAELTAQIEALLAGRTLQNAK